jgi:hypothetical protein
MGGGSRSADFAAGSCPRKNGGSGSSPPPLTVSVKRSRSTSPDIVSSAATTNAFESIGVTVLVPTAAAGVPAAHA